MVLLGFKEQFAQAVEEEEKRQSLRPANCIHKKGCGKFRKGLCDPTTCEEYEHRIKQGDTLQLYTGLMQRKYCNNPDLSFRLKCFDWSKGNRCSKSSGDCGHFEGTKWIDHRGAKLLKTATCTESFPIKFEDLTEEHARKDGFEDTVKIKPLQDGRVCPDCEALMDKVMTVSKAKRTIPVHGEKLISAIENFPERGEGNCRCTFTHYKTALENLKDFLIKHYNAKDGDVFQVIRW